MAIQSISNKTDIFLPPPNNVTITDNLVSVRLETNTYDTTKDKITDTIIQVLDSVNDPERKREEIQQVQSISILGDSIEPDERECELRHELRKAQAKCAKIISSLPNAIFSKVAQSLYDTSKTTKEDDPLFSETLQDLVVQAKSIHEIRTIDEDYTRERMKNPVYRVASLLFSRDIASWLGSVFTSETENPSATWACNYITTTSNNKRHSIGLAYIIDAIFPYLRGTGTSVDMRQYIEVVPPSAYRDCIQFAGSEIHREAIISNIFREYGKKGLIDEALALLKEYPNKANKTFTQMVPQLLIHQHDDKIMPLITALSQMKEANDIYSNIFSYKKGLPFFSMARKQAIPVSEVIKSLTDELKDNYQVLEGLIYIYDNLGDQEAVSLIANASSNIYIKARIKKLLLALRKITIA